ncbi:2,5-dichloro-2,5-cyclohexadiene-1,4-diol dehydrogenase-like [Clytia hemisphaerica]|uniref:2,5-dichloro-2,5-cyclohexadiene-1,4-diol dehydrogenase-like n=1 Tax=Clytia hemisphaerica TaxID=252671 RepID=UPI0034D43D9E
MNRNRVALITGGGSGIGRSAAIKFADNGFHVVVADVNLNAAKETVLLLKTEGLALEVDVSNEVSVKKMMDAIIQKFEFLDVAFNNAGVEGLRLNIDEYPTEMFNKVIDVNLKGIWLCMKYELKQMLKQDLIIADPSKWRNKADFSKYKGSRGSIINTSSTAGFTGMPEFSPYCASKWGIIGLTQTAAKEYAANGIRVNAVCPATTNTTMRDRFKNQWPDWQTATDARYPVGRICTPEEVAEAVFWLASDACPFATGEYLKLSGGM